MLCPAWLPPTRGMPPIFSPAQRLSHNNPVLMRFHQQTPGYIRRRPVSFTRRNSVSSLVDELTWLDDLSVPLPDYEDCRSAPLKNVSLLSWNILAQPFANNDDSTYPGKKPKQPSEPWDVRFRKILQEVTASNAGERR